MAGREFRSFEGKKQLFKRSLRGLSGLEWLAEGGVPLLRTFQSGLGGALVESPLGAGQEGLQRLRLRAEELDEEADGRSICKRRRRGEAPLRLFPPRWAGWLLPTACAGHGVFYPVLSAGASGAW